MNRDILIKINYIFIALLLIGSSLVVMYHESPERLIQGEWVETGWRLEKDNASAELTDHFYLQEGLRQEILRDFRELDHGIWRFNRNRALLTADPNHETDIEWLIKGRGHVLELRKNGKQIESFQIQQLSDEKLVLHLNFDLQVKGIMEIVLERKEQTDQYAKKI
ncbi:hypothetical protein [Sphingobacterium sp. LRF_L2]|uniref:hypothetical protein n=1 Tax=Sphingobacterium sp. LRF_L2 TaxID=3369421 RepID=UPI003F642268